MKKLCLLALSLIALVQAAAAIPAFARKYGYSCEVCHAPVPRLKAFGEQFMDNGYRIPDKEPPRATVDTGDPPAAPAARPAAGHALRRLSVLRPEQPGGQVRLSVSRWP